jgi:hypothetical protein
MRSKGSVPIDLSALMIMKVIGAIFMVSIIFALYTSIAGSQNMCVGPFKSFYAGIADMTGVDMCVQ